MKLPFATSDEFVARYRDNVTRGGIYLRAKKVLPPGTMVNLDIKLSGGERLLHGSAIVHFVTGQTGAGPSGIGLKFLGLDDKSQLFLTTILAGQPGAFSETPPIPAGVGPVQYAEAAKTPDDTAVTRVMEVPANLADLGAIPLPGNGPRPSAPVSPPSVMPMDSMSIPLPSPGGSPPPRASTPMSMSSSSMMDGGAIALPSPSGPPPAPAQAQSSDPFNNLGGGWAIPPEPPRIAAPSAAVPLPSVAPVMAAPPPPRSATQPMMQSSVMAPAPAAAVTVDPALLERLEIDPSSPFALLGVSPGASVGDASSAAQRIRQQLHLESGTGDAVTGRLRRILSQRLDAAVREVEKQGAPAPESPEAAALRAMLHGNAAETYQYASNSSDPALASLAVAAASSIAAEHRSAEWLAQAKAAAQRAEGAPRLFGDPWALVAQAAHALGDPREVQGALAELARQQPDHPFTAKPAPAPVAAPVTIGGDEPKKRGGAGALFLTAVAMAVIGAGGGIVATKKLDLTIPGLDDVAVSAVEKTTPAEPAVKKTPAATEVVKATEGAAADPKATADKAAADAKAASDAKTAADAQAAADKAAADAKTATDTQAATDAKATADAKAAADKAAADKAAADAKATADAKAASDKAAADAKATADAKAAADKAAADAKASADAKAAADKAAADAKAVADAKAASDKAAAEAKSAEQAKATDATPGETQVAAATAYDPAKDDQILSRAERAIDNGGNCNQYLAPLGEVFANNPSPGKKGKALIMRARCYDSMGKSGSAKAEYRKYVSWFPKGSFVDEARDAQ